MKFVFVGYHYSGEFSSPEAWLKRIEAYTGILKSLSRKHKVISIEQINYEGNYHINGAEYHFLSFRNKRNLFPWSLHSYIKKLCPDVVIVHGLHVPLQVLQLRVQLGSRVKIIVQHHAEKPFTGLKKYFQQLADRFINAYLFASYEMGLEWVRKGNLPNEKKLFEVMEASSVFYPIAGSIAREKIKVSGSPVFLWVGRLDKNKDPLTVVKAFLQFVTVSPLAKLYMLFHTNELLPQVQHLIQTSNYPDSIQIIGKVEHAEMLYWFNSADFIISGSHYEGSGVAVCEAMSCGCVPIVTAIPSFIKMTNNGNCGLLYSAGDSDQLVAALKQSTEMNLLVEKEKVLQQFKKELSFEAIAQKIHEVAVSL